MKNQILKILVLSLVLTSCMSIPKETISLSKTLGNDLVVLQNSHQRMVQIYYDNIKTDINFFVDDVYSPFVINYVLKIELAKFKKGEPSLFTSIEEAGNIGGKEKTDEALSLMMEFQAAANNQITSKRNELLKPILKQEKEILNTINRSYTNAINANSTLTGYLESIRKVKESQNEALSIIGLEGSDTLVINKLMRLSELINTAVKKGKEIDIKSDDAFEQLENISNKIKKLTN